MRGWPGWARLAAAALLTACARPPAPGAPASDRALPPNIVLVTADDLGWPELGSYGGTFNDTPQLDRLAAEGVRFTHAYAAAPICSPTRAALMTGQWPARVGILDFLRPHDEKYLHPDHVTLPEMLQRAGYATGLVGKWHLMGDYDTRPGDPRRHGFDEVLVSESVYIGPGDYFHPYAFAPEVAARLPDEHLVDRLNLEATDFIRRRRDRPFFLLLSHYAVHTQLRGRPELVEKYRRKPGAGEGPLAPRNNPHLAAQLEAIDEGIGQIRTTLEELGIADRTVLIFTSDNGADPRVTSTAPLRGAKSMLYEGGIRVPLIVHGPVVGSGSREIGTPVSTVDFYPTLLEIAGVRPDSAQPLDGASLLPLLAGRREPAERALFWHYPLAELHRLGGRSAGAVRQGRYKLIHFYDTDQAELYDLLADPAETRDLARALPARAAELLSRFRRWRAEVEPNAAAATP